MDDRSVVAVQIGRRPRSVVEVAVRCHLRCPAVIAVPPHLDDRTPFPTRFWLTCPLASRRIGRLEAAGGVRAADERIATDPTFGARYLAAMRRYETDRDALIDPDDAGPVPSGGVGGSSGGVKCLHAHYADHAAGNDNPVGEDVAAVIEPLDCAMPCVVEADGGAEWNRQWREPKR